MSLELWELFTKNYENELDSQLNKTIAHPNEKKITISLLQKIKSETNKRFYAMFETVKKLKDSSQFDSNREYFAALHNYLYVYDSSYSHSEQVRKIMANSVDESYLNLENNNIAIMLKVDSNTYKPFKQEYIKYERKMTDRSAKSYLLMNIFTYPADIILDRLGFYG